MANDNEILTLPGDDNSSEILTLPDDNQSEILTLPEESQEVDIFGSGDDDDDALLSGLEPIKPKGSNLSRTESNFNSFMQGIGHVVASLPKAIGEGAVAIANEFGDDEILGNPDNQTPEETTAYLIGKTVSDYVDKNFPTNREYDGEFLTDLSQGAGSMVGFMGGGVATAVMKVPAWLGAAVMGSSAMGVEQADDYKHTMESQGKSVDPQVRAEAFGLALPLGATEALPIQQALNRIDRVSGGGVTKLIKEGFKGGLEELMQETIQSVGGNAIANDLLEYDPERNIFTGTQRAGEVGFTLGFLMNMLTASIGGRRARSAPDDSGDNAEDVIGSVNDKTDLDIKPEPESYASLDEAERGARGASEDYDGAIDFEDVPIKEPELELVPKEEDVEKKGNEIEFTREEIPEPEPKSAKEWFDKSHQIDFEAEDNRTVDELFKSGKSRDVRRGVKQLHNQLKEAKKTKPDDLMRIIARKGGISRESAEYEGIDKDEFKQSNQVFGKPLFPKVGGMNIDDLAEDLQGEGFFGEDGERLSKNEVLDMVMDGLQGEETYRPGDVQAKAEYDLNVENIEKQIEEGRLRIEELDEYKELSETYGDDVADYVYGQRRVSEQQNDEAYEQLTDEDLLASYEQFSGKPLTEGEEAGNISQDGESLDQIFDLAVDAVGRDDVDIVFEKMALKGASNNEIAKALYTIIEGNDREDTKRQEETGTKPRSASLDSKKTSTRSEKQPAEVKPRKKADSLKKKKQAGKLKASKIDDTKTLISGDLDLAENIIVGAGIPHQLSNDKTGFIVATQYEKEILDTVDVKNSKKTIDEEAHEAAASPTNNLPEPSEAQIEANNYKKGHIKVHGFDIAIENPAGTKRHPLWPEMAAHYGDIVGTLGADGDPIDVFVKPDTDIKKHFPIFVIDQFVDGKFDEHKVMMGYKTEAEARKGYNDSYTKDWDGLKNITTTSRNQFMWWLDHMDASAKTRKLPITDRIKYQPNEHGVFSDEDAEVIRFEGKKSSADIGLLEAYPGNWIYSASYQHHTGSFTGVGSPLSASKPQDSREEALDKAVEELISRNKPETKETQHNSEAQAKAAQDIIDWAESLTKGMGDLFADGQPAEQKPVKKKAKSLKKKKTADHISTLPESEQEEARELEDNSVYDTLRVAGNVVNEDRDNGRAYSDDFEVDSRNGEPFTNKEGVSGYKGLDKYKNGQTYSFPFMVSTYEENRLKNPSDGKHARVMVKFGSDGKLSSSHMNPEVGRGGYAFVKPGKDSDITIDTIQKFFDRNNLKQISAKEAGELDRITAEKKKASNAKKSPKQKLKAIINYVLKNNSELDESDIPNTPIPKETDEDIVLAIREAETETGFEFVNPVVDTKPAPTTGDMFANDPESVEEAPTNKTPQDIARENNVSEERPPLPKTFEPTHTDKFGEKFMELSDFWYMNENHAYRWAESIRGIKPITTNSVESGSKLVPEKDWTTSETYKDADVKNGDMESFVIKDGETNVTVEYYHQQNNLSNAPDASPYLMHFVYSGKALDADNNEQEVSYSKFVDANGIDVFTPETIYKAADNTLYAAIQDDKAFVGNSNESSEFTNNEPLFPNESSNNANKKQEDSAPRGTNKPAENGDLLGAVAPKSKYSEQDVLDLAMAVQQTGRYANYDHKRKQISITLPDSEYNGKRRYNYDRDEGILEMLRILNSNPPELVSSLNGDTKDLGRVEGVHLSTQNLVNKKNKIPVHIVKMTTTEHDGKVVSFYTLASKEINTGSMGETFGYYFTGAEIYEVAPDNWDGIQTDYSDTTGFPPTSNDAYFETEEAVRRYADKVRRYQTGEPGKSNSDEDEVVAILDEAEVAGKDRLEVIDKFRNGSYSLDDVKAAYPHGGVVGSSLPSDQKQNYTRDGKFKNAKELFVSLDSGEVDYLSSPYKYPVKSLRSMIKTIGGDPKQSRYELQDKLKQFHDDNIGANAEPAPKDLEYFVTEEVDNGVFMVQAESEVTPEGSKPPSKEQIETLNRIAKEFKGSARKKQFGVTGHFFNDERLADRFYDQLVNPENNRILDGEATNNEYEQSTSKQSLGGRSSGALEGAPTEQVRSTEIERETGSRTEKSGTDDLFGDLGTGEPGNDSNRVVSNSERKVPVSTGGTGSSLDLFSQPTPENRGLDYYSITTDTRLGEGGAKTKYKNNIEAIKVLKSLERDNRQATRTEQDTLARYVGWGGIPQVFDRMNPKWRNEFFELKELLDDPGQYDAAKRSTQDAHYTAEPVINAMYDAVKRLGFAKGKILEPSIGTGNFVGLMPAGLRQHSSITGVELDDITGQIAKHLYPKANIMTPRGFQDVTIAEGSYDLAIGNPPFGEQKLSDRQFKDIKNLSIHNFFFAKSLKALREEGVLAMVVSNSLLDKATSADREFMAKNTRFMGAIRLPNNAFKANAGTQVTTDIIFLQKLPEGETSGKSWIKTGTIQDAESGGDITLNEYFIDNPEMMLGEMKLISSQFGDKSALVAPENQDFDQAIAKAIDALPENIMSEGVDFTEATNPEVIVPDTAVEPKIYGYTLGSDGSVMQRIPDLEDKKQYKPVELGKTPLLRVKGMMQLRDALNKLMFAELSETSDEQLDSMRTLVNSHYDTYTDRYGAINATSNKRVFMSDPDYFRLAALEMDYDAGVSKAVARSSGQEYRKPSWKKADILKKRVNYPYREVTEAKTSKDALTVSLYEKGRIDIDYMQRLTGFDAEKLVGDLEGELYEIPFEGGYAAKDEYLSGNVKQKLADAKRALEESGDNKWNNHIAHLEQVQPADIDAVDIHVKLGSPWIPASDYIDFIKEILKEEPKNMVYVKAMGEWSTSITKSITVANTQEWGTQRMPASEIIKRLMNGKAIQVRDKTQDGSTILNKDETAAANQKADSIKERFNDWIWEDAARRERLAKYYNDTYNNKVKRVYDGSHLKFPGMNAGIELRPNQYNAVWRIIQDGVSLLDHVVGAGKTFTMIAAAMEMRRMGIARKPMIVVPNHLVTQWAKDFQLLYPGANVLAIGKNDFSKNKRKEFMSRIATGDWDSVIMAHSSFGFVPLPSNEEVSMLNEQIRDIEMGIISMDNATDSRRSVKQMEKKLDTIKERIKDINDKPRDDTVDFNELGVDQLFLDESHEFKNLFFVTSKSRVAGIGNSNGSKKAFDLFIKNRSIFKKNNGRGVVFATGTPVSNTMAEMYTIQRYLSYETMKESSTEHFDAWADLFGNVVTGFELDATGVNYKLNSRFAQFVNMPELMAAYSQFADTVTLNDLKERMKADGKRWPAPDVKGGKPENLIVERSSDQEFYMNEIVNRAQNMPTDPREDNMLKVTNDARKMALDMRLIDPAYPDYEGSKTNQAVERITSLYSNWNSDRGTQLVFIDLSTPNKAVAKERKRIDDIKRKAEGGDEKAQAQLDKMSMDEVLALSSGFSVYDDLKLKLISQGIPENEVAFIHDANTELQKAKLFDDVNDGRIRVLIGSTAKMGAGMNVQRRLVALHHLDAPWRPSDIEQREGRIIRQGNMLWERDPNGFEVEIIRYATEKTYDARMWQTLEVKARFIEQLRQGDASIRKIDDIGGESANFADLKASATGNPIILEQVRLAQEITMLEAARKNYQRSRMKQEDMVRNSAASEQRYDNRIAGIEEDIKTRDSNKPAKDAVHIEVNGKLYSDKEAGVNAIYRAATEGAKTAMDTGVQTGEIAKIQGMSVYSRPDNMFKSYIRFGLDGNSVTYETEYNIKEDKITKTGFITRLNNLLKSFEERLKSAEQSKADGLSEIVSAQEQLKKPFEKEDDYQLAKKQFGYVMAELERMKDDKYETMSVEDVLNGVQPPPKEEDGQESGDDGVVKQDKTAYDISHESDSQPAIQTRKDGYRNHRGPAALPGEVRALGIAEKIKTEGSSALLGHTIQNAEQLAELAQVFRNPLYETFRYFFTKNNTVVHASGHTSRLPGQAPMYPKGVQGRVEGMKWVRDQMKESGADGYWVIHNHPSGNPAPSDADVRTTENLARSVDGYLGHVVINSNKYAEIQADGNYEIHEKAFGNDALLKPSKDSILLNKKIGSPEKVAHIAKSLQQDGFITVVGVSGVSGVRAITEIDAEAFYTPASAQTMVRQFVESSGSDQVFLHGARADFNEEVITGLIRQGYITDAVIDDGRFSFRETVNPVPGKFLGKDYRIDSEYVESENDEYGRMFYSQMNRVLSDKLPNKGTARSFKQSIQAYAKKGDFKAEELEWSGVIEWLESNSVKKLTKSDVLDYVTANQIQIEEVEKGGEGSGVDQYAAEIENNKTIVQTKGITVGFDMDGNYDRYEMPDGTSWSFQPYDDVDGKTEGFVDYDGDIKAERFDEFIAKYKLQDISEAVTTLVFDSIEVRDNTVYGEYEGDGGNGTKYGEYTLPGGENYRELLLTLPTKDPIEITGEIPYQTEEEADDILTDIAVDGYEHLEYGRIEDDKTIVFEKLSESDFTDIKHIVERNGLRIKRSNLKRTGTEPTYSSSHWGEKNILAHVRYNERTDSEGKRVLFIEETQSDWHQAGRKNGYKRPSNDAQYTKDERDAFVETLLKKYNFNNPDKAHLHRESLQIGRGFAFGKISKEDKSKISEFNTEISNREYSNHVPNAPLKTTWPMLVMKRMIRHAAENGFDRVAWTTGEQQADRYSLRKKIQGLTYSGETESEGYLVGRDNIGYEALTAHMTSEKPLSSYIGKALAEKILNKEKVTRSSGWVRELNNVELEVGGEGMKGFYDNMLPKMVNRYLARFGVKVGKTNIYTTSDGKPLVEYGSENDNVSDYSRDDADVHSIDITDSMRESVMEGQALFQNKDNYKVEKKDRRTHDRNFMEDFKYQPVDQAFRKVFELAKIPKATKAVFNQIEKTIVERKFDNDGRFGFLNPIIESTRAGIIDRYGVTDEYKNRDHKRETQKRIIAREGFEFLKQMMDSGMTTDEAKTFKAMLEGEDVPESRWNNLSAPIRQSLDDMGHELVELGWLDAETFERHRGKWLHRVYVKHESDESNLHRWVNNLLKKRRAKMYGNQLKRRGIDLYVDQKDLLKVTPREWWGKKIVKKGDKNLVGRKFHVFDRLSGEQGTPEFEGMGEGGVPRKIVERVYWPTDMETPAKYKAWENKGTFEVRGFKNGQVDLWRDYSKEERESMGEILDSRYILAKTYSMLANDLSTARFYKDIAQHPDWTWHHEGEPDPATVTEPRGALSTYTGYEWVKVPESNIPGTVKKSWGPLAGKFIRAEIYRDLHELNQINKTGVWRKALTQWKLNKTARNPVVHMNNVMSNMIFMDLADIRWTDLSSAIHAMREQGDEYKDAEMHGLFGSTFIDQEIREQVMNPILDELIKKQQTSNNGVEDTLYGLNRMSTLIVNSLKKADDKLINSYAFEDELFRMATYLRKRGQGMDAEKAAMFAREQFLNYDIRAPWVNAARQTVLPFIAYTYRAIPVVSHAIAERPWKLAKYVTLAWLAESLAYAIAPGDEEKERKSLADQESGRTWLGTSRMLRMPWKDNHNNPVFLDIRRWIPAGDVFDTNQGQSPLPIPAPLQFGGPLMLAAELMLNKQSFTGKEIVNYNTDTKSEQASKIAGWAWRSWLPAAPWIPESWYWQKIERSMRGGRDQLGREYGLFYAISSSVGVKLKPHDVNLGYKYHMNDIERTQRELKYQAKRAASDKARNIIDDVEYRRQIKSIQKKIKRLNEIAKERFKKAG